MTEDLQSIDIIGETKTPKLRVLRIWSNAMDENGYVALDRAGRRAFAVDPGGEARLIRDICEKTGCALEYILLTHGHFDHIQGVKELKELLSGRNAHMNLIPVNPVREKMMKRPSRDEILAFQNALEIAGIHATIRRSLGTDIDGACGQLRYSAALSNRDGKGEEGQ